MNYCVFQGEETLTVKTASIYPSPYYRHSKVEYVQFHWKEPVLLRIVSVKKVESVVVRPLSAGIQPVLLDGEIRIQMDFPRKLSVEINGDTEDSLLLFAEQDHYREFDVSKPEVVYFPAGEHSMDLLTIEEDNTVVYLEEGAYVHGKLVLSGCSHVTVCGYGALTMERYPVETRPVYARCVDAIGCKNVTIRDITILDSNDWSLRICGCEQVLVENVKIFGCRGNSDGVDICGSRQVLVQDVFTRVWDDSLVVKALDTGDAEDIIFRNCVLWNDFARPMEVGVELRADRVRRVRFENIDVLHSPTGYPLMGIHHGDRAEVSDIVFEKIRIEDAPGAQLFDIRITPSYWNRDTKMGYIRGVVFREIQVLGEKLPMAMSPSRLQGYSREHCISEVTFENINLCGKTPGDIRALNLNCMDFVEGVRVLADERLPLLHPTESSLEISREFVLRQDGFYEGELTLSLQNQMPYDLEKEFWLKISPEHAGEYDREKKQVCIPAGGVIRRTYPVTLQPGKYVAAIQSGDPEVAYDWRLLSLDWCMEEKAGRPLEFVNYQGDRLGTLQAWWEQDYLVLETPLLRRPDASLRLYAAKPAERQAGEVVFSVEETDFGHVPAVLDGLHGLELAPQLRCPLEITLVFQNEPKVEKIHTFEIQGGYESRVKIPWEALGVPAEDRNFWIEIECILPETEAYRYPYTLFHSVIPLTSAHMYGNVYKK